VQLQRFLTRPQLLRLTLQRSFWEKDDALSDSLDVPMDLIKMPFLLRQAVRVVSGIEFKLSAEQLQFNVCSRIRWFKIRETYPTTGQEVPLQRRDFRGTSMGRAALTASGLHISGTWGEPYAGCERTHFSVTENGCLLTARSLILLRDGRGCSYTTCYRKPRS
jgi:hypothetical protein